MLVLRGMPIGVTLESNPSWKDVLHKEATAKAARRNAVSDLMLGAVLEHEGGAKKVYYPLDPEDFAVVQRAVSPEFAEASRYIKDTGLFLVVVAPDEESDFHGVGIQHYTLGGHPPDESGLRGDRRMSVYSAGRVFTLPPRQALIPWEEHMTIALLRELRKEQLRRIRVYQMTCLQLSTL